MKNGEPAVRSGRQGMLENILNDTSADGPDATGGRLRGLRR